MGDIYDFLSRGLNPQQLEESLSYLISQYNGYTGRYLYVMWADVGKENSGLIQEDYYITHDLLHELNDVQNLDVYIETPGGSGETAEEIIKFLHKKFPGEVNFVIAGEAKSAGTIMALGGNNISM